MSLAVFILSAAGARLDVLDRVLTAQGVETRTIHDLPPGKPLRETIRVALELVDFVILVIDNRSMPMAVSFEAGLAAGLGKPLVVLDARTTNRRLKDELPVDVLIPGPRMFARLDDEEGLDQEVAALLRTESWTHDQAPVSDRIWSEPIPARATMMRSERDVWDALAGTGAEVVGARPEARSIPDLLVDFPELGHSFNPVMVEVVGQRADLRKKLASISQVLERAPSRLALVVTLDDVKRRIEVPSPGVAVLVWSYQDLLAHPDQAVLDLVRTRNQLVHGR